MHRAEKDQGNRFALVLGRLLDCETRIKKLLAVAQIRDFDEIWEAFCDVEEGIALSNFALGSFDRLGKRRKLTVSQKDDPDRMTDDELRKKFSLVQENLRTSLENFSRGTGEDGVELARRARDFLKIMLIAHSSAEKRSRRSSRTSV
jgi:hypothetical protein